VIYCNKKSIRSQIFKDKSYELPKNRALSVGGLPSILQRIYQKEPNASGNEFTPKDPTEVVIQMAVALKAAKKIPTQDKQTL